MYINSSAIVLSPEIPNKRFSISIGRLHLDSTQLLQKNAFLNIVLEGITKESNKT